MQRYIKDAMQSRWYDVDDWFRCEKCNGTAVEVHHINNGRKRHHKKDGSDLIFVCRSCHEWIHNHNTFEVKELLLSLVKKCIK